MKQSVSDLLKKKEEAKRLITVLGCTQKEAAKKVGVSVVSMSAWCNKYEWTNKKEIQLKELRQDNLMDFALYVEKQDKGTFKKVMALLVDFLTTAKR